MRDDVPGLAACKTLPHANICRRHDNGRFYFFKKVEPRRAGDERPTTTNKRFAPPAILIL